MVRVTVSCKLQPVPSDVPVMVKVPLAVWVEVEVRVAVTMPSAPELLLAILEGPGKVASPTLLKVNVMGCPGTGWAGVRQSVSVPVTTAVAPPAKSGSGEALRLKLLGSDGGTILIGWGEKPLT